MKMTAQKRALDKIYKRRDRYEIPDWQREKVWTKAQKQKLIDSILRGWKLPKFYFLKAATDPEEFEVVDGQQRLLAIFEFFDGDLTLAKDSSPLTDGALVYKNLPDHLSDRFDDYEIEYDEIEDAAETDLKEFFQRLQEGLPLTSSEKLNSVHSKLRDYCRELAGHPFLAEKTAVSPHRYGHFDIVAKVAALEIEGFSCGLRFEDLKVIFETSQAFSGGSAVASRLRSTFDALDKIFAQKDVRLRNRTIVQSFATFVAKMVDSPNLDSRLADLQRYFDFFLSELSRQVELGQRATDEEFIEFQRTVNANVKTGPLTRQRVLVTKMLVYDPTLSELFDATTISGSGLTKEVGRLGEEVGKAVTRLNSEHAAKHGMDLIKPTNRTVEALGAIGRPVSSLADYGVLVDNLYFLFHEGVGDRLGKKPASFADIRALRTERRHDLDHGKAGDVKRKRRGGGATFRKYAGVSSPQALGPELFPAVQAKLLSGVLADLESLRF